MYLPTGFSGPEKEYESLINDVTFGDFAAERQVKSMVLMLTNLFLMFNQEI